MTANELPMEIKVILLGETGTGKTSLINVSVGEKFDESIFSTLSTSITTKKYKKGKKEYILNIWDTNGQEKYRSLTKTFISNSKIVIFVYSIDNEESFVNLKYWIELVNEIIDGNVIKAVVENKSDLDSQKRVKDDDGKKYADYIGAKFRRVSAKTEPNGFSKFLGELLTDYLIIDNINKSLEIENSFNESFKFTNETSDTNKKFRKKCCK